MYDRNYFDLINVEDEDLNGSAQSRFVLQIN